MSLPSALCEYCAEIPLDPNILEERALDFPSRTRYTFGSRARIKSSPCPFCRLILHTFSEDPRDAREDFQMELYWGEGPGGREALMPVGVSKDWPDTWIGFSAAMAPPAHDDAAIRENNWKYFIEPTTGPVVDTARILRWISSCEQQHGSACALPTGLAFSEAFRGLHLLRLVDVEANCVVERTRPEKYVALSYVWGAVSNFRLTKANRPALLKPGSLTNVSSLVPKTIKDAIILTRRLGCRYLWVDALCLVQNDAEDLEQGVNAMDLIYERAWLTLVAGCGHDANARLPGVQGGTRRASENTFEIIPGVEMGVVTGLDGWLKSSVYDSRAWTFQEKVLSRRVLYFAGDKVFYRCRAAEHAEHFTDILQQHRDIGATVVSMLPEAVSMREPVFDFGIMLLYYTPRALTNQNDAPRAMAGILRRFTGTMKCHFFQGLPTAMFDRFIIFCGDVLHRRTAFPSYSWIGWRGAVDEDLRTSDIGDSSDNQWLQNRTWIVWYKRSPCGITNLVWDPDANPSFPLRDMEYVGYRTRRAFSDGRRVPGRLNTRRTMPTEDMSFSRTVPPYPILQFWTLSLFYRISGIDVFRATGYLTDSNNAKCGFVWLDGFEETTLFESQGPFEVILLSETYSHGILRDKEIHSERIYPWALGTEWTFYNVLLLEWQGGIAERRGFGLLHQRAVDYGLAPGPSYLSSVEPRDDPPVFNQGL